MNEANHETAAPLSEIANTVLAHLSSGWLHATSDLGPQLPSHLISVLPLLPERAVSRCPNWISSDPQSRHRVSSTGGVGA